MGKHRENGFAADRRGEIAIEHGLADQAGAIVIVGVGEQEMRNVGFVIESGEEQMGGLARPDDQLSRRKSHVEISSCTRMRRLAQQKFGGALPRGRLPLFFALRERRRPGDCRPAHRVREGRVFVPVRNDGDALFCAGCGDF